MATTIPDNRCAFTLKEAADAVGASEPDPSGAAPRATSVSIDTRTLQPGAIFVALRGITDGHRFLRQAAERGAAFAIVERGRKVSALPCLEVESTLDALGRLARAHLRSIRAARAFPVISIGGAAGKTTTKELTAAAAQVIFGPTLKTPGNLNNLIGVPMTIFTAAGEHRAAVLECGTNTRGEIPGLAAIVEPDVAALLNVGLEHSAGLGSLEEITAEECAIFAAARRFAVVPAFDLAIAARIPPRLRTITFGTERGADVCVASRTPLNSGRTRVSIKLDPALVAPGDSPLLIIELKFVGAAAALNCAAAIASVIAASSERITGAQLLAIGRAFSEMEPIERRLSPILGGGALIIDDSYNAQPPSMRIAIETAREIAASRGARLILILGDMLELGALAPSEHDSAIRTAFAASPAIIVAVGPEMCAALARHTHPQGGAQSCSAIDSTAAAETAARLVKAGDVALVKGSLGMRMNLVTDALLNR